MIYFVYAFNLEKGEQIVTATHQEEMCSQKMHKKGYVKYFYTQNQSGRH